MFQKLYGWVIGKGFWLTSDDFLTDLLASNLTHTATYALYAAMFIFLSQLLPSSWALCQRGHSFNSYEILWNEAKTRSNLSLRGWQVTNVTFLRNHTLGITKSSWEKSEITSPPLFFWSFFSLHCWYYMLYYHPQFVSIESVLIVTLILTDISDRMQTWWEQSI